MLIDTHAHLNSPEYAEDLDIVIGRMAGAGVEKVICVGYDIHTSERAVELAERDPRIYATVGVHPNNLGDAPADWQDTVARLATHPRVVGIGETGLDYYRDWTPPEQQQRALRWHFDLARDTGLPIILHNRESDQDLTEIALDHSSRQSTQRGLGVLHSFCGSMSMMEACVAAGYAVSFSGMVTFSNKSIAHVATLAREAPSTALLIETDCPYLAPAPNRGQKNEPAFVRLVAARLASLRETTLEEIEDMTARNAQRVFPGLGPLSLG